MRTRVLKVWLLILALLVALLASGAEKTSKPSRRGKPKGEEKTRLKAETFTGLSFRGIGPAVTSGRVGDLAIHPKDRSTWYVAVASGGVWKTTTAGTTWTPIFDGEGSYSIGSVTLDPRNPLVVWVGTGENNSQRSVGYGNGLYKSTDGGKTWENVGLKSSEHIAKILIDPRDSNVVIVAAQGPLWSSGGDRGLYKTLDGGKSWKQVLKISDNTGITDLVADPRNPDVLFAASYQRRRHVWTLIDGGPESAIHKSTDGGATWKKLEGGLPKEEMGRIALAIAPSDPDVTYALIEAAGKAGGFYRSTDAGGSWKKMGDYVPTSPQYYTEIFPDPRNSERVYSMDTFMQVTEDGGKSFHKVGERYKHVDNHVLWIDPDDTDHLIAGCDGGLYVSFDRGANWEYKANLPVTQFYRVTVDNSEPFYYVYGGTQDNQTLGGPSRNASAHGIVNSDWFVTVGGDGFWSQVDPKDPNIVYSESQYGGLVRFDRRSGEILDIQPQPGRGEEPLRWNWDSPLLISPHSPTRLYFGAQRLFRSEDRGDSWRPVSEDLTRRIDRNALKVMGRIWSVDSVAKNASTSFFGNIVSLSESPKVEGLIYAGSDDGLISVTEDGGKTWRKSEKFSGVPDMTYVSRLNASRHDSEVVYAAFDNHQMGDFKPYLLKSGDRGKTWTSIAGDLPERGSLYALAEDSLKKDLLFAGTEFGVFFTPNGGRKWIQLKGGLPTIAIRDLAVQDRESDLVLATFGRGFYVLDDYSPLRSVSAESVEKEAELFPVKRAWMYVPTRPFGLKEKSFFGEAFYSAANPPFGAVFTYYLKEEIKTTKKTRQEKEKEKIKKGEDVAYPSWEQLKNEDREEDPVILLTIKGEDGSPVRTLSGPVTAGYNRIAWDLRFPPSDPTDLTPPSGDDPFQDLPIGPLAAPGSYRVSLAKRVDGKVTPLGEPQRFEAVPLGVGTLPVKDREALAAFQRKTARLQRAVLGAIATAEEARNRLKLLKQALLDTPGADPRLSTEARALEVRLRDLQEALSGDSVRSARNEPTSPSISGRVQQVITGHWTSTSDATGTHRRNYEIAAAEFKDVLDKLRVLVTIDLDRLEKEAEGAGAPWTPGRFPTWTQE
ncbi:MAG TPA: glycosyl hydrolase [Candidatus Polarisedimenticolia bacterium]|nr:glycosyl hydrolase [Candidatus Polarisedimenticolia bacterium]